MKIVRRSRLTIKTCRIEAEDPTCCPLCGRAFDNDGKLEVLPECDGVEPISADMRAVELPASDNLIDIKRIK
jgi:hypothetical protein